VNVAPRSSPRYTISPPGGASSPGNAKVPARMLRIAGFQSLTRAHNIARAGFGQKCSRRTGGRGKFRPSQNRLTVRRGAAHPVIWRRSGAQRSGAGCTGPAIQQLSPLCPARTRGSLDTSRPDPATYGLVRSGVGTAPARSKQNLPGTPPNPRSGYRSVIGTGSSDCTAESMSA
jgi:hypothetical protein